MVKNAISMFFDQAASMVKKSLWRTRSQAVFYAIAMVAGIIGLVFLCVAIFYAMANQIGALWAAWAMVGFWLVIFAISWFAARYIGKQRKETSFFAVAPKAMPEISKEQKQIIASSAISALMWVARRSSVMRFAASFAGISAIMQTIRRINKSGSVEGRHKPPDCRPPRYH